MAQPIAAGLLMARPSAGHGQIDYRNLDDDRPTLIEDAYLVERYAFEFLAPWRFGRDRLGGSLHAFTPEIEYGILRNGHLGLKLPIAGTRESDDRERGICGLKVFALYNINTESRILPGLAIRTDPISPVGSLAGEGTRLSVKAAGLAGVGYLGGDLVYRHAVGIPTAVLRQVRDERVEFVEDEMRPGATRHDTLTADSRQDSSRAATRPHTHAPGEEHDD